MSEPREGSPAFVVGSMGGKTTFVIANTRLAVDIPPAALESEIALTARQRSDPPPGHLGPVFELGPSGTRFREPVTLRAAPPPLPSGLSFADLAWATEENGKWLRLPTRPGPGGTLEGETTHFSTFAMVSNCHDAGTKKSFVLTGCPVFDPTITTSSDVTLDATAGRQTLILRFGAGSGTVTVKVEGLTPGHLYFRYADSFKNGAEAKADSTGIVTFQQELADPHTVILQWSRGSIDLAATTCPVFLGTFDAVTATCTMDRDVEESIALYDPNLTLDCAGHRLGSNQVPRSLGLWVSEGARRATIKNCTLVNHDMGIVAARTKSLTVINTTIKTLDGLPEGMIGLGVDHSEAASLAGLSVERYRFGVMARSATGLDARRAFFKTRGGGLVLATGGSAVLRGVDLEGDSPEGPFASVGIVFADEGTFGELHGVTGRNLGSTAAGIRIDSAASGIVRNAVIEGPMDGLFLGRGPASEVSDSTFTGSTRGIVVDGQHHLFHNNIHGNLVQAYAFSPGELSDTRPASATFRQGNYWGRSCPASLFVPGLDSTRMDAVDSYPYGAPTAWATGGAPGCPTPTPMILSPQDGDLTKNPRPTVSGTAAPGSDVTVSGSTLGTATATAQGLFSVTPSADLTDGLHVLTAVARLNGRDSMPSLPVRLTIDTVPPLAPTITVPVQGMTTFDASVTIAGNSEPSSSVAVFEGSAQLAQAVAGSDGSFAVVPSTPLSAGTHTVFAQARDRAGNASAPSTGVSFTVRPLGTTPAVGPMGKVSVTSVTDSPDPFTLESPDMNVLTVDASVKASSSNSNQVETFVVVTRDIIEPGTRASVARFVSDTRVPRTTGSQPTPVTTQMSWDGRDLGGTLVAPKTYLYDVGVSVMRTNPGGGNTTPPDCTGAAGPPFPGRCIIDVAPTVSGTVTVLPSFIVTADSFLYSARASFVPGRETQALIVRPILRAGPGATFVDPTGQVPRQTALRYFLRLHRQLTGSAGAVQDQTREQEVYLLDRSLTQVGGMVALGWDGRDLAGKYVTGTFTAKSTLEYVERKYASLDAVLSERVLARRLVGPPRVTTDPLEEPQRVWNSLAPQLANGPLGAVVLATGADTGLKPEALWSRENKLLSVFGKLAKVPLSTSDPLGCAATGADISAAAQGFVRRNSSLFGLSAASAALFQLRPAAMRANDGRLCTAAATQTLALPFLRNDLVITIGPGGDVLSLTGNIETRLSVATGPITHTATECMDAISLAKTELIRKGVDTIVRDFFCRSGVTLRLSTGQLVSGIDVVVTSQVRVPAVSATSSVESGTTFDVGVDMVQRAVVSLDQFDAPTTRSEQPASADILDFDPGELDNVSRIVSRTSFPVDLGGALNVISSDKFVLRGMNGAPWDQALNAADGREIVASRTSPLEYLFDGDTPHFEAATCYGHMRRYLDHIHRDFSFGSPSTTFGTRGVFVRTFPVAQFSANRLMDHDAIPNPASSARDGIMRFRDRAIVAKPSTCTHEFFHQMQWELWDPEYRHTATRRMTQAIVEGSAAFVEDVNSPYPVSEVDVLLFFFKTKEWRARVWPSVPQPTMYREVFGSKKDGDACRSHSECCSGKCELANCQGGCSRIGLGWSDCRGFFFEPSANVTQCVGAAPLPTTCFQTPKPNSCVNVSPIQTDPTMSEYTLPLRPFGSWDWNLRDGVAASSRQNYHLVGQALHRARNALSHASKSNQTKLIEVALLRTTIGLPHALDLVTFRKILGNKAALEAAVRPVASLSGREVDTLTQKAFELHGIDDALEAACTNILHPPCG